MLYIPGLYLQIQTENHQVGLLKSYEYQKSRKKMPLFLWTVQFYYFSIYQLNISPARETAILKLDKLLKK